MIRRLVRFLSGFDQITPCPDPLSWYGSDDRWQFWCFIYGVCGAM